MDIKNLMWLTDVHLNFLDESERREYYQTLFEASADAALISGDIGEAPSVRLYLQEMAQHLNKPIYFVLGNHDYYRGTVSSVHEKIEQCERINSHLHWLGNGEIVHLSPRSILLGIDAWADARYGDFVHSPIQINDSRLISDLFLAAITGKNNLQKKMAELADIDAAILQKSLTRAMNFNPEHILICAHVPPFPESCVYEGEPTDRDWLPFFSSKALGDVIASCAKKYPKIQFTVVCGHTHSYQRHQPLENLSVKVGQATYGSPEIQEILKIA